ncbi:hypothetical protein, conserved [Eimeria tenella]|uniref:Uncharacterized protein n=1 Tax=Eimeria tenella TaxID=5802 RepID=U6KNQ7_EIMTE|nr:hypothetical protein, conserved [Eimeria tenella]CDJ37892.1 hypothetical protein, conserved [Eimeria tenella]|eukprot:XP_013228730.1 hypothetical protein, conserved [Eimeria tenella]
MAPVRAAVRPVTASGLEEFKDLALPLDVHVLQHDEDTETVYVTVPNESAIAALEQLPGYSVSRLAAETQQQQQQQQQTTVADAAADSYRVHTTTGGPRRKVLPSGDLFYLITDIK